LLVLARGPLQFVHVDGLWRLRENGEIEFSARIYEGRGDSSEIVQRQCQSDDEIRSRRKRVGPG
jgi:hypothetical protein